MIAGYDHCKSQFRYRKTIPRFVANASYGPGYEVDSACNFTNRPIEWARAMLEIRAGQQALWRDRTAFPGPDTDGLIQFGAECPLTYFSSLIHADPFPGIGTGSKLRMAWVGLVRAR